MTRFKLTPVIGVGLRIVIAGREVQTSEDGGNARTIVVSGLWIVVDGFLVRATLYFVHITNIVPVLVQA